MTIKSNINPRYRLSNIWMAMADRYHPTSEIALHAADRHDHAMQHRKNGKNQNKIYYVTQIKW